MKLRNWSQEQEQSFQNWVGRSKCPTLLHRIYRIRFRDRNYTPNKIDKIKGGFLFNT